MPSIAKYIGKNLLFFLIALLILFLVNLAAFIGIGYASMKNSRSQLEPGMISEEMVQEINRNPSDIHIGATSLDKLDQHGIWALVMDNDTGELVWTHRLPPDIPKVFSRKDVALFSRYYLKDYPVFTYLCERGLLVLGYPKDSYFKFPGNYMLIHDARQLPAIVLIYVGLNIMLVFIIYMLSKQKLLRTLIPLSDAMSKLPNTPIQPIQVKGELSCLAEAINATSKKLQEKDTIRANWIAGVSHDIRTPLTLILGYADKLSRSKSIPAEEGREVQLIRTGAATIQRLVDDLNMTSRLEYNLVPLNLSSVNLVSLLRQIAVDAMNADRTGKYSFDFEVEEHTIPHVIQADRKLLERALNNLLQNSMKHNPEGCSIRISITKEAPNVCILIADDGKGCTKAQLEQVNQPTEQLLASKDYLNRKHGLGLVIVKQVISLHHGTIEFISAPAKGFQNIIRLSLKSGQSHLFC